MSCKVAITTINLFINSLSKNPQCSIGTGTVCWYVLDSLKAHSIQSIHPFESFTTFLCRLDSVPRCNCGDVGSRHNSPYHKQEIVGARNRNKNNKDLFLEFPTNCLNVAFALKQFGFGFFSPSEIFAIGMRRDVVWWYLLQSVQYRGKRETGRLELELVLSLRRNIVSIRRQFKFSGENASKLLAGASFTASFASVTAFSLPLCAPFAVSASPSRTGPFHFEMSLNFELLFFSSRFQVDPQACVDHHISHSLDLATTLKTELAASNYKRDRVLNELVELKSTLCARDAECETLRVQTARQSALISSLQSRLTAAEQRDRTNQAKAENTTQTLQREKKILDDRIKDLAARARRLEADVATEESQREQIRYLLREFKMLPSFLHTPSNASIGISCTMSSVVCACAWASMCATQKIWRPNLWLPRQPKSLPSFSVCAPNWRQHATHCTTANRN